MVYTHNHTPLFSHTHDLPSVIHITHKHINTQSLSHILSKTDTIFIHFTTHPDIMCLCPTTHNHLSIPVNYHSLIYTNHSSSRFICRLPLCRLSFRRKVSAHQETHWPVRGTERRGRNDEAQSALRQLNLYTIGEHFQVTSLKISITLQQVHNKSSPLSPISFGKLSITPKV